MPKRGLPTTVKMRHDTHYVEELARASRTVGKIIQIDKIQPNPDQPRVEFGDLEELTSSIKEQGVLEPLLVKPNKNTGTYMIIAGERRWRASNLAGLTEVPCIELDIDNQTIAEIALVENLQRKDLTIWEIADGLADLNERYGYTHDEIAKKIGKSRSTVTESIAIAGLPKEIRTRCQKAKISSKSTLIEISRQFDEKAMFGLIDKIESESLNRSQVRSNNKTGENKPEKKSKSNKLEGESVRTTEARLFSYTAKDNTFNLTIKFNKTNINDKDILKALKEAFDNTKL